MKFIHYIDEHDITHHVDISNIMSTDTFPLGRPNENGVHPIMGTRICLKTYVGGFVISKEPADVIWDRVSKALDL